MPESQKNNKDKQLTTKGVRQIAAGIALTGALLGGLAATQKQSVEVPERAEAKTEYVAQGAEVEIPGLKKGDTVQIFEGNFILDIGKGNVRSGPSVYNDARNGEDNTVKFDGVVDNKIELQNPILYGESEQGSENPNGRILMSTVNGKTIYMFVDAYEKVAAIENAQTGEQASFDSTVSATIDSTREDGVVAHLDNNEPVTIASTHTIQDIQDRG